MAERITDGTIYYPNDSATDTDYVGFSFNGIHLSNVHVMRISEGNRYGDNLIPAFQDKTAAIEGGDGVLYWDSYYTSRTLSVSVSFDALTEVDLRTLRQMFNARVMGRLIFDERPYKYYMAKIQSPPQFKMVCFEDSNGARVYKGEGTINFVCYFPFAQSVNKYSDQYADSSYPNKSQWIESSGMVDTDDCDTDYFSTFDLFSPENDDWCVCQVSNTGDLETDFKLFISAENWSHVTSIKIGYSSDSTIITNVIGILEINPSAVTSDYICINTKTHLIEGYNAARTQRDGKLYNSQIISGDFFKIPKILANEKVLLGVTGNSEAEFDNNFYIDYSYLYY